jgi:hypothetical protein
MPAKAEVLTTARAAMHRTSPANPDRLTEEEDGTAHWRQG